MRISLIIGHQKQTRENKMEQLAKDLAETFQAKCYDKETACEYMGKQQWQYSFVIKVLGYM